jgi:hypothetical protein
MPNTQDLVGDWVSSYFAQSGIHGIKIYEARSSKMVKSRV